MLCQDLVDLANEKGGVDNITVVFVRIPGRATLEKIDRVQKVVKAEAPVKAVK